MKLKEALEEFKNLESKARNKAELKVFQEFIQILNRLKEISFSETELQLIESELDAFGLNSASKSSKRLYKKAIKRFKKFLKDEFSLTPKGYYTNLGIGLGSSFGILFGIIFLSGLERSLGISLGVSLGMLIGLIIGRNMDAQAKDLGKMI